MSGSNSPIHVPYMLFQLLVLQEINLRRQILSFHELETIHLQGRETAESLLWIALLKISTNEGQTLLWVRNKSNSMTFLGCSCIQTFPAGNISICINKTRTFSHPIVMTSSPPTFRDHISTLHSPVSLAGGNDDLNRLILEPKSSGGYMRSTEVILNSIMIYNPLRP